MAKFIGTQEEFKTFFGGYMRNRVWELAKEFKAVENKCMNCGKTKVEYAHLRDHDRLDIANEIISKNNINGNCTIDTVDFSIEFDQAHIPIEKHGYALCRSCHRKYDSGKLSADNFRKPKFITQAISLNNQQNEELETMLTMAGKKNFAKYYEALRDLGKDEIIEILVSDGFSISSAKMISKAGKAIFDKTMQNEALNDIISSKKIDQIYIDKAIKLYRKK